MFLTLPLVALGGALGAVLRQVLVSAVGAPWGTALVNILGSFAIGVLFILLASRGSWQPFLITGVLGGFTTFSAFSLDTLKLWEGGQALQAFTYIAGSLILSLAAVTLGAAFARSLT